MVLAAVFFMVVHLHFVMFVFIMFMSVVMGLLGVLVTDRVTTVLGMGMTLLVAPHLVVVFVVFVLVTIVVAAGHFLMFKLGSMLNAVVMLFVRTYVFISHNSDSEKVSALRLLLLPAMHMFLIRI